MKGGGIEIVIKTNSRKRSIPEVNCYEELQKDLWTKPGERTVGKMENRSSLGPRSKEVNSKSDDLLQEMDNS